MLELKNVSKTFNPGTVNEKKALDGLSVALDEGDFVTIVGSNGAGKSTLFNAVAGDFYVDEGSIVWMAGTSPICRPPPQPADRPAVPGSHAGHRPPHDHRGEPGPGLSPHRQAPAGLFQPGVQGGQGILPGAALPPGHGPGGSDAPAGGPALRRPAAGPHPADVHHVPPKLLLLDEHTAALDPATAEKVLTLTREIVEEHHITTLMITHNMKNALEMGSRTLMMDNGRIVLDIGGEERKGLTVDDLLTRFQAGAGKALDNDRILLS